MTNSEQLDPFDVPMDGVQAATEEDMAAYDAHMDAIEEAATVPNSIQEADLAFLRKLHASGKTNAWETGFCQSCIEFLSRHKDNKLSPKQSDVLQRTILKYKIKSA